MSTEEPEAQSEHEPHVEEERRFLVSDVSVYHGAQWEMITQAYFLESGGLTYRLRLTEETLDGKLKASVTAGMKGPRADGKRREDEAELLDVELARQIIDAAPHVVRKRRYAAFIDKEWWSVDEFLDGNAGLVIAELEGRDGIWSLPVPRWALREVTFEDYYNNEILAFYPMRTRWYENSPFHQWLSERNEGEEPWDETDLD